MKCPRCNRVTREPPDEQGSHPCSHCGWDPTLWHRTRDAADEIVAALQADNAEDAAGAIEDALPLFTAFLEQEA